jgi:acyl-CoA synthetase (AMP-forming)/AMP-acid ligase II
MNLIDFFDRGALHYPARPCFIAGDRSYTYREVRALTLRLANGLRSLGFAPGAKGAVLSPNDPIAFGCALSILRAGGAWVPVNPKNGVEEHVHVLGEFDCEVLFYHSALQPVVDQILERVPGIRNYLCVDTPVAGRPSVSEWATQLPEVEVPLACDPERLAMLVGTGGTTGKPKGVMLSNRNVETFCAATMAAMPYTEPPVYLAAAPLTHAAGILCFPLMSQGATTVVHSKVDPQEMLKAMVEYRVDTLFLPPTAIYMLLAQPNVREVDYARLRYFIYGAAPMSVEKLKEALEVFGPVMAQLFGQSEAPMMVTFMTPHEHFENGRPASDLRLKSCGRATPFVRAAVMDDDGRLLPANEIGEIVVQGDLVMQGYYKNPEATALSRAFGWHHTGDLGYRDDAGYYYIVDRKKDLIISGGFNIYPGEIEQVIWSHEAVQDCAVIGVPDEKWGEAVRAVIELKQGASVTAEELIALCKSRLGSVKAPKSVEFVDTLPRSPVGKVLKKELRATYWSGRERKV